MNQSPIAGVGEGKAGIENCDFNKETIWSANFSIDRILNSPIDLGCLVPDLPYPSLSPTPRQNLP